MFTSFSRWAVSRTSAARISVVEAAGLGVDAAGVGDADDEVEVAHGFGEDDGWMDSSGKVEVVTAPGEVHAYRG